VDYTIQVDLKSGGRRLTTYRRLLSVLGLEDEEYLGEPLKKGTISQARYVIAALKSGFSQIRRVAVYDEKHEEVAAFGIDLL